MSDLTFYSNLLTEIKDAQILIWYMQKIIELKKGDFKPEYTGKMNFYCSAADDL